MNVHTSLLGVFGCFNGCDNLMVEEQDALARLIKWCGNERNLHEARRVHARVLASKHSMCVFLVNLVIAMYGKCGSADEAMQAFESVEQPNFYSWNILMCAFTSDRSSLHRAKLTFDRMPQWDVLSWTALLAGYGRFTYVDEASSLFSGMPARNEVSWNTMVTVYTHCGHLESAARVFDLMPSRGPIPWNALLSAYSQSGHLQQVKNLFEAMPMRDFMTWTTLFQTYANAGHLQQVRRLFDHMPQRDVVSHTGMIRAYVIEGQVDQAKSLFDAMPEKDTVTWNVMLCAFAQKGQLLEAMELFHTMPCRDIVSWTTVCLAHAQRQYLSEARNILERMPGRDLYTCNGMIAVYAQEKHLELAKQLFASMPEKSVISWTAMIAAYAQNGCVREARCLFDDMDLARDTVAWNAILKVCCRDSELVSEMFGLMNLEGQAPDKVTFLHTLSACCDGGCIESAWNYFTWMISDFGIAPIKDHYNLVMNVLCKAGKLEHAEDLILHMPFLPDTIDWGTLLSSYKLHRDVERARMARERLLESSSNTSSVYVLLASIWEEV